MRTQKLLMLVILLAVLGTMAGCMEGRSGTVDTKEISYCLYGHRGHDISNY